jgi:1,2-diacylglycerol 3-alpha-glucosyltransferase
LSGECGVLRGRVSRVNICHFTNTFLPHVGGVARAVQTLLEDQREARHRVLVVAPEFAEGPAAARIERSVLRIPALTHFNSSDFSVRWPLAAALEERLADFPADLLHAHHPFLLGDTALREGASRGVPVVFTHHTLYEHYTHYLPLQGEAVGDFAAEVATRFANRCAAVVAPSRSVRDLIVGRGVTVPVEVIPTGIDTRLLASGDGAKGRAAQGLPPGVAVIGHLGRLAAEKNLRFLTGALVRALGLRPEAWCLIVGDGPERAEMERAFAESGVGARVVFTGKLSGRRLRDACASMDVFAFASCSETQGLVLAEVMAAGVPVVALDAPGVREMVRDGKNGRLLPVDSSADDFARVLGNALRRTSTRLRWGEVARRTAATVDRGRTTRQLLSLYEGVVSERKARQTWRSPGMERLVTEGQIFADKAGALLHALAGGEPTRDEEREPGGDGPGIQAVSPPSPPV